MPEDAAWFWSRFLSFRLVKEDSASASADHAQWTRPLPLSPAEDRCSPGWGPSANLPVRAAPPRALCMSPSLTQPRKLLLSVSATRKPSMHLFWEKNV